MTSSEIRIHVRMEIQRNCGYDQLFVETFFDILYLFLDKAKQWIEWCTTLDLCINKLSLSELPISWWNWKRRCSTERCFFHWQSFEYKKCIFKQLRSARPCNFTLSYISLPAMHFNENIIGHETNRWDAIQKQTFATLSRSSQRKPGWLRWRW